MCGRFTLKTPAKALAEHFGLSLGVAQQGLLFQPRYNIAPTQNVSVVRAGADGQREAVSLRWGLVPSWSKDGPSGRPLINARSETVADKPSFRSAYRRRRCLIPADGFFEWQTSGKRKQPFYIRQPSEEPMSFAGLWEIWDGTKIGMGQIESCVVLTTAANNTVAQLHDRMPVILSPDDYDCWLDPAVKEQDQMDAINALLQPATDQFLTFDPVTTFVNKAMNEGPECVTIQRELF